MTQKNIRLYNGDIELVYKETPKSHSYWVDGKRVMGVTTPLNIINKPALMYWSVNVALDYINNNWQCGRGYDELEKADILATAKKEHTKAKEKAGTKGSLVHDWIHQYMKAKITGTELPKMPTSDVLKEACHKFINWMIYNKFTPLYTEKKILSLKHWYSGTLDVEGIVDRHPVILDIKNSSGIWNEYRLQLAAYIMARREESKIVYPSGYIIRIGDEAEIEELEIPEAEYLRDFEAFLHAKALYQWQSEVNKTKEVSK